MQVKDTREMMLDSSSVSDFHVEEYYASTNKFVNANWYFSRCDSAALVVVQMSRHIDGFRVRWKGKRRLFRTLIIQTYGGCCDAYAISQVTLNGKELEAMENSCEAYEIIM